MLEGYFQSLKLSRFVNVLFGAHPAAF